MYPGQFGFRAGHSTDMALIDDRITSAIDDKKFSLRIFLDLVKAFDTVTRSTIKY